MMADNALKAKMDCGNPIAVSALPLIKWGGTNECYARAYPPASWHSDGNALPSTASAPDATGTDAYTVPRRSDS